MQAPHPPVRIAANSPDTFPFAARRNFPIFATPLINPPDKLKEGLARLSQHLCQAIARSPFRCMSPTAGRRRARIARRG